MLDFGFLPINFVPWISSHKIRQIKLLALVSSLEEKWESIVPLNRIPVTYRNNTINHSINVAKCSFYFDCFSTGEVDFHLEFFLKLNNSWDFLWGLKKRCLDSPLSQCHHYCFLTSLSPLVLSLLLLSLTPFSHKPLKSLLCLQLHYLSLWEIISFFCLNLSSGRKNRKSFPMCSFENWIS